MLPHNDSFTCDCLIRTQGHRRSLCVTQIIFISNTIPYGVMDCLFSVKMWMIKHLFTLFCLIYTVLPHLTKQRKWSHPSIHPSIYPFIQQHTILRQNCVLHNKIFKHFRLKNNNPSLWRSISKNIQIKYIKTSMWKFLRDMQYDNFPFMLTHVVR